jgi:serine/threonine protein kinase
LPKIIRTIGHIRKLGLAHMDIKPNNILGNKEGTRVLIADLGGVKALREEADSPSDLTGVEFSEENSDALSYVKDFTENFGLIYGSSGYMAPETINGQSPVPETDMFSWAMLAIQATTGELPVDASTFELYKRAIVDESPVPVEIIKGVVPADLYQVVKACSNKDPGMRFGPDHALQLLENA